MLKRGSLVLLLALGLAGCDNDNPTEPADPNVVVFRAQLSAANEVPAITNAESGARGDVLITMRVQRDGSNNITGATFDFVVNLNSFPAGSTWTLAHIHEGPPGVAGGVRVDTGLTGGATSIPIPNGTISNQRFTGIVFGPGATIQNNQRADFATHIQQLMVNPNGYYFNVHTTLNGGGAVRGPLVIQ
jgi:CHRD domain